MSTPANPVSAPPAAAAAPAAATASTSTTAPVTATPATPATDGAGGALSSEASVNAMLEAAKAKGFGEDQAKPAAETSAADSGAVDTEKPAASETENPAAEVPAQDTEGYTLDEDGFVGAKDLAAKIDANPALKAALSQEDRDVIMANARLAETAAEYRKLFASPAEATIIHQTAQEHAAFAEAFNLIQSDAAKGTTALINKLIESSYLRDADGKPLMYEDGKTFKTDGSANKFVETLGKRYLNRYVVQKVAEMPEGEAKENAQAALDLVMESVGLRASTADKTQDQDPALAARKAALDAQEAEIKTQRETSQKEQRQQYTQALEGEFTSLYDGETGKLLDLATGLDKFTRAAVEQKLETAIREAIGKSVAYKQRKATLQRMPMDAKRRTEELKLAKEFFRDNLARIARPILAEAGVSVNGKGKERTDAQAARVEAARSEVNGGRAAQPNAPGAAQSPTQQIEAARTAYKQANGGKEPNDSELNIFMMLEATKRKGLAA